MKAELVPLNGDPPIAITRDVTLLGRREYCDVVIPHPSLSKRHCVLVRTDGLLIVRDLISTNGTKVNGQRVMWAALLPNDKLTLGRAKFRVYLGPDNEISPSELGKRGDHALQRPPMPLPGLGPQGVAGLHNGFAAPSPPQMPALDSQQIGSIPDFAFEPADLDEPEELGLDILDDEEPIEPFVIELDEQE
jgi:pSer/pThr/pTyr-binding forkhead associated (FHA) protein